MAKGRIEADGDAVSTSKTVNLLLVVARDATDEVDEFAEDVGCGLLDGGGHVLEVVDAGDGGEEHG